MRRQKSTANGKGARTAGGAARLRPGARRASELMELATVAAHAQNLPEFLKLFSERVASMLPAEWCGVVVMQGQEAELQGGTDWEAAGLEKDTILALFRNASRRKGIYVVADGIMGTTRDKELLVVPVQGSDSEPLGAICVYGARREIATQEKKLLHALASHAALSLENFRRFSQLERSKRQWVQDIDAISDFIVVHDRAWKIVRTNRSLANYLGMPPVALVGEAVSSLRTLAEGEGTLPCPFCLYTGLSKEEHIISSAEKIYLVSTSRASGTTDDDERTIHVLKDITDRREAERRYRELYDSIQEGLFFATPDGRFLDVNDAMVRMLGYASREELLRADVSPHLYPAPEAREKFLKALSERGVLRNYEETLRRKDGTLLHTLQNITAVRDSRGNIAQIRGLMLDVTEQKTFQSQLQRERDFNQKILNTTQSMILVLDTAGLISYANRRCFEAGYRENELIGHRLVTWVESSHREDFEDALQTTAHGQQGENLGLRVKRSDGSMGHFSISLSPMRDESSHVNSVVVVMTDITDAALLQAKLAHAEKMATIGRLVSGVAHEVNNPLAAILGFTDLLLENPQVPENARQNLKF